MNRDDLGRVVRETWIGWAKEQPDPKPSRLVPYDALAEPDREVDRRIGEVLYRMGREEALRGVKYRDALVQLGLFRLKDAITRHQELYPDEDGKEHFVHALMASYLEIINATLALFKENA